MTTSPEVISSLRQRMIDDKRMRRLAPETQASYVRVDRQFAVFLGRSPDTATIDDLRRYQHVTNTVILTLRHKLKKLARTGASENLYIASFLPSLL
jgi:hypothetical protein